MAAQGLEHSAEHEKMIDAMRDSINRASSQNVTLHGVAVGTLEELAKRGYCLIRVEDS